MRPRALFVFAWICCSIIFTRDSKKSIVVKTNKLAAKTGKFIKPPKQDRIDLAMQFDFEMTKDPALGKVPIDRLWRVKQQIRKFKSTNEKSLASEIPWEERGPVNVGGRTRALIFDKNDPSGNTVFAGSVSGGLWKTSQIQSSNPQWSNLNSQLDNLSVSVIAQDPSNPQIIYIGTGEGYFNGTGTQGMGVWKSTNGGNSWSHLSSTNNSAFRYIQRILIDNNGNLFACTFHAGVQKSTNGGASWQKVLGQGVYGNSNRAADIELASNGNLYATLGLYSSGGIYKSTNQGASWTELSAGLPGSGFHRIEMDVAPSNPNRLYALFQDSNTNECKGIYKSNNGGTSWTEVDNPSAYGMSNFARNQAWYNLEVCVDPSNPDRLIIGGIDLHISEDAGSSWDQLSQWNGSSGMPYVHADQHVIQFHPTINNKIIAGNDGGVWYASNGSSATPDFVQRNTGYNVTQFYSADADPASGMHYFLAGAQDNGNQRFNSSGENTTEDVSGGDGGIVHIDQNSPNVQIVALIYNNYMISLNGGNTFYYRSFNNLGRFINPSDYDDDLKKFYAADQAGKYLRWNDPSVGGANSQLVTVLGMNDVISFVKVSPNVSGRVYFATGNGDLFRVDQAQSGTVKTGVKIRQGTGAYLSSLDIEPGDENHLIISYSNYGVTSIYESYNGGSSWSAVEGNLPDMPVRSIVFNPNNYDQALIGTEAGIWAADNLNNNNTIWAPMNNSLPIVRTDMLKFRESDSYLIAATHGRGLFTTGYFDSVTIGPEQDQYQFHETNQYTQNTSCPKDYKDFTIPVEINKAPNSNITVFISTSNGSAQNNKDFQLQTSSLTFPAGSVNPKNIIIRIYDDAIDEANEIFYLSLSSSGAQISPAQITIDIKDDDNDPMNGGGTAQEYQIGNDQIGVTHFPLRGFYEDERTQILFHASELISQGMTAGAINSLSFDIMDKNSTQAFNNFQIAIKHSSLQNTSQPGDNFENGFTTVYQGNLMTNGGWNKINFNQTFDWNGVSNILVQICFDNNFWSLDDKVATTETIYNSVQYRYADSQSGCQLSTIQSVSKKRPNIRFYMENSMNASNMINDKSSPVEYNTTNHYFDQNSAAIASLRILNGNSVSCASASIESTGVGMIYPNWLNGEAISEKSFFLDIQSNTMYEITLYFNADELALWPDPEDLSIIKTSIAVPGANQFTDVYWGEDLQHFELANGMHAYRLMSQGDGGFALSSFNSSTVPVELLEFDVTHHNHKNKIQWTVAHEIDIEVYAIERSFDGKHFEEIHSVEAQNFPQKHTKYSHEDPDLWLKNRFYYYRLRIVEQNGVERYSTIRNVFVNGNELLKVLAYPNPCTKYVRVSAQLSEGEEIASLEVQDLTGRPVLQISVAATSPEYRIDMSDLMPGIYLLDIRTTHYKRITKKISLVK